MSDEMVITADDVAALDATPVHTHTNRVGEQPTYFVPDTGSRGATGTLVAPDGRTFAFDESNVVLSPPPDKDGTQRETTFGPRVGFKLPVLDKVGIWTLAMDQDGESATYLIRVIPALQKG